jgi:hypothetical protein
MNDSGFRDLLQCGVGCVAGQDGHLSRIDVLDERSYQDRNNQGEDAQCTSFVVNASAAAGANFFLT